MSASHNKHIQTLLEQQTHIIINAIAALSTLERDSLATIPDNDRDLALEYSHKVTSDLMKVLRSRNRALARKLTCNSGG
jgi:hypothetical protein